MSIDFDETAAQIPLTRLTDDQLDELRRSLAALVGRLEEAQAEKAAAMKEWNASIEALREEVSGVAREIREQEGAR